MVGMVLSQEQWATLNSRLTLVLLVIILFADVPICLRQLPVKFWNILTHICKLLIIS